MIIIEAKGFVNVRMTTDEFNMMQQQFGEFMDFVPHKSTPVGKLLSSCKVDVLQKINERARNLALGNGSIPGEVYVLQKEGVLQHVAYHSLQDAMKAKSKVLEELHKNPLKRFASKSLCDIIKIRMASMD